MKWLEILLKYSSIPYVIKHTVLNIFLNNNFNRLSISKSIIKESRQLSNNLEKCSSRKRRILRPQVPKFRDCLRKNFCLYCWIITPTGCRDRAPARDFRNHLLQLALILVFSQYFQSISDCLHFIGHPLKYPCRKSIIFVILGIAYVESLFLVFDRIKFDGDEIGK